MRVLVVGEGKNDVGYQAPEGWRDGVLPELVRRLLRLGDEDEIGRRRWKDIRQNPLAPRRPIRGFDRRTEAWMYYAKTHGFAAVILVADRDGRVEEQRIDRIRNGRDQARAELGIDAAVGVAVEMIEAWLLADEQALRQVTGNKSIPRQPDPETLASRTKDSPSNPKHRLRCLIDDGDQLDETYTVVYARIAATANLDVVADLCAQGFKPFREDVERLRRSQQTDSIV